MINTDISRNKKYINLHFGPIFAMVCPDIDIAHFQSSKNMEKKKFLAYCHITQANIVLYLIRTNFREALISRFSRFVKNREI